MTAAAPQAAPSARTDDRLARLISALAVLAVVGLLSSHLRYVPMWDGRAYAECAVEASLHQLAPFYLRCWGHASHFYIGLLGIAEVVDPGSGIALVVVNAILLGLGAIGFHRLTRLAFPADDQRVDRALLCAAFLLQPPALASVLQPGLDLPVMVGVVWVIALLLERRWRWTAIAGTALVFSKETGVLLYALVLACYGLWLVSRSTGPLASRLRALASGWPAAIPLAAYLAYLAFYWIFRPGQPAMWTAGIDTPLVRQFFVPRVDAYLASYLALLLVLNFAWLPSTWLIADAIAGAVRLLARAPRRPVAGADTAVVTFLTLLCVSTGYALTRFLTFSNVRYLMAASALLLVPFYASLLRLSLRPRLRRLTLVAYALALVVSAERTVDPVSRRLWGTFPFGSHEMLRIASLTGECCGIGRDQLVYSLEFARLHELTDDALAALAPDSTTLLVIPATTSWYTIGPVDARTHRRTLRRAGTFPALAVEHGEIMKATVRPDHFTFLALPNANVSRALTNLALYYQWGAPRRFEHDGYAILAYDMTQRHDTAPLPP